LKEIVIQLSQDIENLEIIPISDVHLGDSLCNIKLLQEQINYIRDNDNVYCVLLGDLINNAIKSSVSDIYKDVMSPMKQLEKAVELFGCIKDKILTIVEGNHERRTSKESGIDITRVIAKQLGIEDRYSEGQSYIFLSFGKNKKHYSKGKNRRTNYTILCSHGNGGGGKRLGGKVNALSDMLYTADADIYIVGHTHTPLISYQAHLRSDTVNKVLTRVESLLVNINAYLEYGGYGEQNGYHPSSLAVPHLFLAGDKVKYYAKL